MATRVETPYTQRARYYSSLDGFNIKKPAIPAHAFVAERDRAFDPAAPTGLIPCDLSRTLEIGFPATAPLVLARYVRIRAGERLATRFAASGALYYVIAGSGETVQGPDAIAWDEGDAFCLPGGAEAAHIAGAGDCLLYVVTNEPLLAFERLEPPRPGRAPIEAVHYPADEIQRQLDRIHRLATTTELPGKSISFGTAELDADRVALPSFTFSMNSLSPGETQRPHQHNAVAVTLVVQGERCYSMIDGRRVDWQPWTVMITPPAEMHSHHNDGDRLARFLIVQDGGLHYHARTMGFSY
jgi:gentisate 1,2-dioxygenase